ncbi:MAG: tRNA ((37)-N6)-threonylcarbamoyltransferase complex dimerization subunit type 1 TsaB [Verrucomicrobiota bacterium]|jgi:tRNA threonylcarbamoyladenosine biosynthesis protein TsaB
MKLLALEFSSTQRSVAVACNGVHVREAIESGRGNTMQPFAMIESVLTDANVQRGEIERIVIGLGPGSYAGIRAGIALAQGWHLARNVQLAGVSSAETIAAQAQAEGLRGRANVVIDAQRGEFYCGIWELSDGGHREIEPLRIVSREAIAASALIIGPEVTKWFADGRIIFPRASMLAKLDQPHPAMDNSALEPIYLRETSFAKAPPPREV